TGCRVRTGWHQSHGLPALRLPGERSDDLGIPGRIRQQPRRAMGRGRPGEVPLPQHAGYRIRDGIVPGSLDQQTTMYVNLFQLFAELSRLLEYGGRYVCITGCYNDVTGGRSKAVSWIDEHYICNIHPRSEYF